MRLDTRPSESEINTIVERLLSFNSRESSLLGISDTEIYLQINSYLTASDIPPITTIRNNGMHTVLYPESYSVSVINRPSLLTNSSESDSDIIPPNRFTWKIQIFLPLTVLMRFLYLPPVDQNNNVETQTEERPTDAETQTDTDLSRRGSRRSSTTERSSDR